MISSWAAASDLSGSGRAALRTVTAPAFWVAVIAIAAVLYLLFG